jgi:hypothetical protein
VITFPQAAAGYSSRTLLVSLLLITAAKSGLEGQDTTRVSATMLRVLAEAADGNRTGRPVFFVADYRFPHQVAGPFDSREEAERLRADSGSTFGVFGPYVTPPETAADTAPRVVGIRITMMTRRGRQTIDLDPRKVDALFLSGSAGSKFVIPYYAGIYGPEYADRLQGRLGPLGMFCHIRPSYLCIPRPDGSLSLIRVMEPMGVPPR